MNLTHWELRALIRHQLAVVDRVAEACPQQDAHKDLAPAIDRLKEIAAAYLEASKPYSTQFSNVPQQTGR